MSYEGRSGIESAGGTPSCGRQIATELVEVVLAGAAGFSIGEFAGHNFGLGIALGAAAVVGVVAGNEWPQTGLLRGLKSSE